MRRIKDQYILHHVEMANKQNVIGQKLIEC